MERREKQDNQERLDLQEDEEHVEMMVPKETLVQSVSLVILVHLVRSGHGAKMALKESEEKMESKENLALLVHLGKTDLWDLQERGVQQEPEVQKVDRERKEPRETPEPLAHQERQVQSGSRVRQENLELMVCVDFPDPLASKDLLDRLDRRDHQDPSVHPVCLVCVGNPVPREKKDTQVSLV